MINKLCVILGSIAKDKILHYLVAYIIFDLCLSLCLMFDISIKTNLIISFSIVTILILLKELIDQITYGGWDNKDILAGYLGVFTKLIIFLIMI